MFTIPPAVIRTEGIAKMAKYNGPLQVGGIISSDPFNIVEKNFASLGDTLHDSGCKFSKPHLVPLFLPFLAIPSVRITAGGIVNIKDHAYIKPLQINMR